MNTKLCMKVNIYLESLPEGANASERSWSLIFISFTVNLALVIAQVVHEILNDHSIFTFNILQSKEEEFFSDDLTLQNASTYSPKGTDSNRIRHSVSSECILSLI